MANPRQVNDEPTTTQNTVGPRDVDGRPRVQPETDVAPVDPEARATSQNAGMPGTQPSEFLAEGVPGDQRLPPAIPRVAREAGIKPSVEP